jgi:hypothetical protein
MKKNYVIPSILFFSFFAIFGIAHAAGTGSRTFGGKILNVPALEIKTAEEAGMVCEMSGEIFDIKPVGKSQIGPYLISFTKNPSIPRPGAWILGLSSPTLSTIATCTDGYRRLCHSDNNGVYRQNLRNLKTLINEQISAEQKIHHHRFDGRRGFDHNTHSAQLYFQEEKQPEPGLSHLGRQSCGKRDDQ